MPLFKLAFSRNEVISCKEVMGNNTFNKLYKYEHEQGRLLYALIKAPTGQQAIELSRVIAIHVQSLIFGDK